MLGQKWPFDSLSDFWWQSCIWLKPWNKIKISFTKYLGSTGLETNKVNIYIFSGSMAAPFSEQGKQQKKFTVRQVLEQLEDDDSDFGPELDSDSDSDELFQPHESNGGESSAQDSDFSNDSPNDENVLFTKTASPQMEPNHATKTYRWQKTGFELPDVNFQSE